MQRVINYLSWEFIQQFFSFQVAEINSVLCENYFRLGVAVSHESEIFFKTNLAAELILVPLQELNLDSVSH